MAWHSVLRDSKLNLDRLNTNIIYNSLSVYHTNPGINRAIFRYVRRCQKQCMEIKDSLQQKQLHSLTHCMADTHNSMLLSHAVCTPA